VQGAYLWRLGSYARKRSFVEGFPRSGEHHLRLQRLSLVYRAKEAGISLPKNQRQHRTSHIQKDVMPYTCTNFAGFCAPCQPLWRTFPGWIRPPPPSLPGRAWVRHPHRFPDGFDLHLLPYQGGFGSDILCDCSACLQVWDLPSYTSIQGYLAHNKHHPPRTLQ
jgi:hypothetical protein